MNTFLQTFTGFFLGIFLITHCTDMTQNSIKADLKTTHHNMLIMPLIYSLKLNPNYSNSTYTYKDFDAKIKKSIDAILLKYLPQLNDHIQKSAMKRFAEFNQIITNEPITDKYVYKSGTQEGEKLGIENIPISLNWTLIQAAMLEKKADCAFIAISYYDFKKNTIDSSIEKIFDTEQVRILILIVTKEKEIVYKTGSPKILILLRTYSLVDNDFVERPLDIIEEEIMHKLNSMALEIMVIYI